MSKIEALKSQIKQLSAEEFAELRRWYAGFDAAHWDRQLEADVNAGRLDALAEKALRALPAGQTMKL